MGTRSLIGKRQGDGTIWAIYCHWDGYPEYVGRVLVEHWIDPEKVDLLLEGGFLSSLGEVIGEKHQYGIETNQCTFHIRDMGRKEDEAGAMIFEDISDFLHGARIHYGVEYAYLLQEGHWLFSPISFMPMKEEEEARYLRSIEFSRVDLYLSRTGGRVP